MMKDWIKGLIVLAVLGSGSYITYVILMNRKKNQGGSLV